MRLDGPWLGCSVELVESNWNKLEASLEMHGWILLNASLGPNLAHEFWCKTRYVDVFRSRVKPPHVASVLQ